MANEGFLKGNLNWISSVKLVKSTDFWRREIREIDVCLNIPGNGTWR